MRLYSLTYMCIIFGTIRINRHIYKQAKCMFVAYVSNSLNGSLSIYINSMLIVNVVALLNRKGNLNIDRINMNQNIFSQNY